MADVQDIYAGIISPNGGLYKPGPEVVFPSPPSALNTRSVQTVSIDPITGMPTDALAQILMGDASGRPGAAPNQPAGSIIPNKDQTRLTPNAFGYGENGVTGQDNSALAAIEEARRPDFRNYAAPFRPTPLLSPPDPGNGGLFGIPMSPGMEAILATGPNRQQGPWRGPPTPQLTVPQAAIAQALIQASPAIGAPGGNNAFVRPSDVSSSSPLSSIGGENSLIPAAVSRSLREHGYI